MAGIGGAITAGLASAANSFADFDAKLKDIQTSTGATSEEVEMMSKKITQLGDGATSIEQITQGFSALAANGASLQEMNVIMESATQLMSGFGASAETASGILQTAVRAYGVSLEQLETTTDQLAEAGSTPEGWAGSQRGGRIPRRNGCWVALAQREGCEYGAGRSGLAETIHRIKRAFRGVEDNS